MPNHHGSLDPKMVFRQDAASRNLRKAFMRRGFLALAVLMVVPLASPLFAVNLVTNPGFNGNLAGWNAGSGTAFDGTVDSTGTAGSGSARTTFNASGAATQEEIDQCIAAGPGTYTLGAKVFIPTGQAVGGSGLVTVSFFSGPDCVTGFLSFSSLSASTTGSFVTLSGPITAPAGTAHIWITGQNNTSGAGTHVVNFDDFVLDNGAAPPPVPLPSSLWMALIGCIFVFIAFRRLRRAEG